MNPVAVGFPACLISHNKMWQENFHLLRHYVLISLFFLALVHLEPAVSPGTTWSTGHKRVCPTPFTEPCALVISRAQPRKLPRGTGISPASFYHTFKFCNHWERPPDPRTSLSSPWHRAERVRWLNTATVVVLLHTTDSPLPALHPPLKINVNTSNPKRTQ